MTPDQFIQKWSQSSLKESAAAKEHFLDLCALLHQPTPAEADPAGDWYTFEKGASKAGGGEGFADASKASRRLGPSISRASRLAFGCSFR